MILDRLSFGAHCWVDAGIAFTHMEGADVTKMKLRLDALQVESFELSPHAAGAPGTVRGQESMADAGTKVPPTQEQTCWTMVCGLPGLCTCDGGPTCDISGCYACKQTEARGCVVETGGVDALG